MLQRATLSLACFQQNLLRLQMPQSKCNNHTFPYVTSFVINTKQHTAYSEHFFSMKIKFYRIESSALPTNEGEKFKLFSSSLPILPFGTDIATSFVDETFQVAGTRADFDVQGSSRKLRQDLVNTILIITSKTYYIYTSTVSTITIQLVDGKHKLNCRPEQFLVC